MRRAILVWRSASGSPISCSPPIGNAADDEGETIAEAA
jgi:hypothetical protein